MSSFRDCHLVWQERLTLATDTSHPVYRENKILIDFEGVYEWNVIMFKYCQSHWWYENMSSKVVMFWYLGYVYFFLRTRAPRQGNFEIDDTTFSLVKWLSFNDYDHCIRLMCNYNYTKETILFIKRYFIYKKIILFIKKIFVDVEIFSR